jgi:hypothetical protein
MGHLFLFIQNAVNLHEPKLTDYGKDSMHPFSGRI